MPRSLGGRLILSAVVVTVVATTLTGLAVGLALHRFVQAQVDGRLDAQVASVADALRVDPTGILRLTHLVDGPPFDRPGSGWYWRATGDRNAVLSGSLDGRDFNAKADDKGPPPPGLRPAPPMPGRGFGPAPDRAPLRTRSRVVTIGGQRATIVAAAPREALDGPMRETAVPLAVLLATLAALLFGGALAQVRLGLRPLKKLTRDLAAIGDGRAARLEPPDAAELTPLVTELNRLLDQNEAGLERARRHAANLAHGLKTPLAALDLALASAAWSGADAQRATVAGMDRLIRRHLSRARMAVLSGPSRLRTPLAGKVADHIALFRKIYADRGLDFSVAVPDSLAVLCDPQDLDEILGNLLDNACKWAVSRIAITAVLQSGQAILAITDDGLGLSPEDTARLGPGRRLDESVPGHGFGLAIVTELVELYGGDFTLARAPDAGLRVTVTMPGAMLS